MTNFFIACILILPWIFIPIPGVTNQFRLPQGMFLNLTFLGMIVIYFLNGARNVYRNKYLALFIGYVFIHIFINFFVPFGLERKINEMITRQVNFWVIEPMIHFILGVFATYIALSYFEKEDYIRIAKGVCWSATLIAIWSIMQFIGFDPYGKMAVYNCTNMVSACLDNPNLVGNYLALSSPFFIMFFRDKKYIAMFLLVLGGIYVAKSHFSQGLTIMGFMAYALLKYRNKKVIITVILLSLLLVAFAIHFDYLKTYTGMSGRLDCWTKMISVIKENPLFGQSLGIWKTLEFKTWAIPSKAPDPRYATIWFSAHNDWLQYIVEIGLIGMFFLVLVVYNTLRRYSFKHEFGLSYLVSFIIFLVMMVASFPLEVPALSMLGLIAFWGSESL